MTMNHDASCRWFIAIARVVDPAGDGWHLQMGCLLAAYTHRPACFRGGGGPQNGKGGRPVAGGSGDGGGRCSNGKGRGGGSNGDGGGALGTIRYTLLGATVPLTVPPQRCSLLPGHGREQADSAICPSASCAAMLGPPKHR